MDLSDDIAFGVHDFEDTLALELIDVEAFERHVSSEICRNFLDWVNSRNQQGSPNNAYNDLIDKLFGNSRTRKHAISRLVGYFVQHCEITEIEQFREPLVRYRVVIKESAQPLLDALKKMVYEEVICSPAVQHLEFKGQQMVVAVFEALRSEPKALLPRNTFGLFQANENDLRVICDHVAGMTDTFLLKTYERLFSPRMGSVFDSI